MADEKRDLSFWQGKRVFITGHTGFIGSWLSRWLVLLGADVAGYALAPHTTPSLYDALALNADIASTFADICDRDALNRSLDAHAPHIVIHLAAQAIVGLAHAQAYETWRVNTLGTVALLDALRGREVGALTVFTTDKVYDNHETGHAHTETDAVGGFGVYDSRKGAAELAVRAFQRGGAAIEGTAIVRAGNVIGGGDWSAQRLVPDCARAFASGEPVLLRHPASIRPWQHVLDLCYATLQLSEALYHTPSDFKGAWNIGPDASSAASAGEIASQLATHWQQQPAWQLTADAQHFPEAATLLLDASKLMRTLGLAPALSLADSLALTASWYRAWQADPQSIRAMTDAQIHQFQTQHAGSR